MVTSTDFQVFEKYKHAPGHAFSAGIVIENDKTIYKNVFDALVTAATQAAAQPQYSSLYKVRNARFFRDKGIQGQRPVDLWASLYNVEAEILARYPQVYMIATELGIELGFAVAIHESDYYDADVKRRNRHIVPMLYGKLPAADAAFVQGLDYKIQSEGSWNFGLKTRQRSRGDFDSLRGLISFLKSTESSEEGGGAIYRMIPPQEFDNPSFSLNREFSNAVALFSPLMRALAPSSAENNRLVDQEIVDAAASEILPFDPTNLSDGRSQTLRAVAVRQGQSRFREKLMTAYCSRCAITGTAVVSTLQAAHILPYRGPDTNHVQNGILLRADIHNLFDLALIQINPHTLEIEIAAELEHSEYANLRGRKLELPTDTKKRPNKAALAERFRSPF